MYRSQESAQPLDHTSPPREQAQPPGASWNVWHWKVSSAEVRRTGRRNRLSPWTSLSAAGTGSAPGWTHGSCGTGKYPLPTHGTSTRSRDKAQPPDPHGTSTRSRDKAQPSDPHGIRRLDRGIRLSPRITQGLNAMAQQDAKYARQMWEGL
jgi:hypothetical protein